MQSVHPVIQVPGEDDPDHPCRVKGGRGPKEHVDGGARPIFPGSGGKRHVCFVEDEVMIWLGHVNQTRLDFSAVLGLYGRG